MTRKPAPPRSFAEHGEPDPDDPVFAYLGGEFTRSDFDADQLT
jgi:hypothetical protein